MVSYARVSITVPRDVLAAADKRARALDRSRSWLVAEALRQYLSQAGAGTRPGRVSEAPTAGNAAREVAEARTARLAADLKLSPEERLRRAEALGRLARRLQPRGRHHQIIAFDTYEDFYQWKKAHRAGA